MTDRLWILRPSSNLCLCILQKLHDWNIDYREQNETMQLVNCPCLSTFRTWVKTPIWKHQVPHSKGQDGRRYPSVLMTNMASHLEFRPRRSREILRCCFVSPLTWLANITKSIRTLTGALLSGQRSVANYDGPTPLLNYSRSSQEREPPRKSLVSPALHQGWKKVYPRLGSHVFHFQNESYTFRPKTHRILVLELNKSTLMHSNILGSSHWKAAALAVIIC